LAPIKDITFRIQQLQVTNAPLRRLHLKTERCSKRILFRYPQKMNLWKSSFHITTSIRFIILFFTKNINCFLQYHLGLTIQKDSHVHWDTKSKITSH